MRNSSQLFTTTLLLATPLLLASALLANAEEFVAREAGRSLLEVTANSRAAAGNTWAAQGVSIGRKRALLATAGKAVSTYTSINASSSLLKNQPTGSDCKISTRATALADCSSLEGYVVPACCSSSSNKTATMCQSWDSGEAIICTGASTPYPACCTFRDQPVEACDTDSSSSTCDNFTPGVGCCDDEVCTLSPDGSAGTCSSGTTACCPA